MAENIDKNEAQRVLLSAFRKRCIKRDKISSDIKFIINNTHKTYKYILVTGLLAKATNEKANALALQAGAPLEGAFDARSLCHNVLVPFERDFLQNALGGSNEPFLNKPARFTHLSIDNAVRRGKDKEILKRLISIFNFINASREAEIYLSCALEYLNQRIEKIKELHDRKITYSPTLIEIYEFVFRFLEESFEGETSAIVVGTLEKIFHRRFSKSFRVIAHKVNQSGASSKEVGDIDIYKEDRFYYSIEVKDKRFTAYDLEHAINKIKNNNGVKGQFIYGPNAIFEEMSIRDKIAAFENSGFMILFQDIFSYSRVMFFKTGLNDKQEFLDTLMETALEMNSKEETKAWVQALLNELKWK